jgi:hypothetical protein
MSRLMSEILRNLQRLEVETEEDDEKESDMMMMMMITTMTVKKKNRSICVSIPDM